MPGIACQAGQLRSEMALSFKASSFENDDEIEEQVELDNTCPECGTDSIATYLDRHSSYEYCTNCDWSDEDIVEDEPKEPIGRRDRSRSDD